MTSKNKYNLSNYEIYDTGKRTMNADISISKCLGNQGTVRAELDVGRHP